MQAQIAYLQSSLCGNFFASADRDGMLEVWGLSALGTSGADHSASLPSSFTWTCRWRVSCREGGGIVGVEWIGGFAKNSGLETFFSAGTEAHDRRTPLFLCVLHRSGALEAYTNNGEIIFRSRFPVQCVHLCWGRIPLSGVRSSVEGSSDTRLRAVADVCLFAASDDGDIWVQRAGFDDDPKPLQLKNKVLSADTIVGMCATHFLAFAIQHVIFLQCLKLCKTLDNLEHAVQRFPGNLEDGGTGLCS